jgi:hypothetical protein
MSLGGMSNMIVVNVEVTHAFLLQYNFLSDFPHNPLSLSTLILYERTQNFEREVLFNSSLPFMEWQRTWLVLKK